MERKLISIIVPVYNAQDSLSKCISSIINQSYSYIEIILINDGSTDKSGEICEYFAKVDSRVNVVHQSNKGVSEARNLGLKISKGEYIQFVDSDDYIQKDMCEILINKFDKSVDLVVCGYTVEQNNKKIMETKYSNRLLESINECKIDIEKLYDVSFFNSTFNKMYLKSKIKKLFRIDISLGEDLLFNLEYLKQCKNIVIIEDLLYTYKLYEKDTLSSRFREDAFEIQTKLYKELIKFCELINCDIAWLNTRYLKQVCYIVQEYMIKSDDDRDTKKYKIIEWLNSKEVNNALKNIENRNLEIRCMQISAILLYYIYNFKIKIKPIIVTLKIRF